jgi:hypothetical protein
MLPLAAYEIICGLEIDLQPGGLRIENGKPKTGEEERI